jgi:predicted ATPase
LAAIYPTLGYDIIILPKIAVADRADFILDCLSRETRQQ